MQFDRTIVRRRDVLMTVLSAPMLMMAAGCETKVEVPRYAAITFSHQQPIPLQVASIRVVSAYTEPRLPPNVEHEFPVSPLKTIERWAPDRLVAVGDSGEAVITIEQASVVEVPLEKKTGITGLVTDDQSERYDALARVTIVATDDARGLTSSTTSEAKRSRTVSEGLTLNEREKAWYELTEQLMRDFDKQLESAVRTHLAKFIPAS